MKIKVVVENVGPNHARVELEETCGAGGLRNLLDEVGREFENFSVKRSATANAASANGQRREDDFTPASEAALKALRAAAMKDGRDVESVCREYGVDPNRISKRECWQMTQELNARSGYSKNRREQPSDKNGGDSFFD